MAIETKAGNVTMDEVRALVGDTDPNQMSSPKMRALLGNRGSFDTIGKFLKVLCAERALALHPPIEPGSMPTMPVEAANAMWTAAWTAAQVATLTRMENLAAERDAALLKLGTQSRESESLVVALDEQTAQLEQAVAEIARTAEMANKSHEADIDKLAATQKELAETKLAASTAAAALAKVEADAAHAAEMAEQGRAMMREELSRLTDQVGELKSHLYQRASLSISSAS